MTDPQFETESIDALEELLARARNFAEHRSWPQMQAEFEDARAFVESELGAEPEVPADD